jgi:hypothetical protein
LFTKNNNSLADFPEDTNNNSNNNNSSNSKNNAATLALNTINLLKKKTCDPNSLSRDQIGQFLYPIGEVLVQTLLTKNITTHLSSAAATTTTTTTTNIRQLKTAIEKFAFLSSLRTQLQERGLDFSKKTFMEMESIVFILSLIWDQQLSKQKKKEKHESVFAFQLAPLGTECVNTILDWLTILHLDPKEKDLLQLVKYLLDPKSIPDRVSHLNQCFSSALFFPPFCHTLCVNQNQTNFFAQNEQQDQKQIEALIICCRMVCLFLSGQHTQKGFSRLKTFSFFNTILTNVFNAIRRFNLAILSKKSLQVLGLGMLFNDWFSDEAADFRKYFSQAGSNFMKLVFEPPLLVQKTTKRQEECGGDLPSIVASLDKFYHSTKNLKEKKELLKLVGSLILMSEGFCSFLSSNVVEHFFPIEQVCRDKFEHSYIFRIYLFSCDLNEGIDRCSQLLATIDQVVENDKATEKALVEISNFLELAIRRILCSTEGVKLAEPHAAFKVQKISALILSAIPIVSKHKTKVPKFSDFFPVYLSCLSSILSTIMRELDSLRVSYSTPASNANGSNINKSIEEWTHEIKARGSCCGILLASYAAILSFSALSMGTYFDFLYSVLDSTGVAASNKQKWKGIRIRISNFFEDLKKINFVSTEIRRKLSQLFVNDNTHILQPTTWLEKIASVENPGLVPKNRAFLAEIEILEQSCFEMAEEMTATTTAATTAEVTTTTSKENRTEEHLTSMFQRNSDEMDEEDEDEDEEEEDEDEEEENEEDEIELIDERRENSLKRARDNALRSRHAVVDLWLRTDGETKDTFADLEDFIVF